MIVPHDRVERFVHAGKVRCAPTPCHLNGWAMLKWGVVFVRESEDAPARMKKCAVEKMDQK